MQFAVLDFRILLLNYYIGVLNTDTVIVVVAVLCMAVRIARWRRPWNDSALMVAVSHVCSESATNFT